MPMRTMVHTRVLSLDELTHDSKTIFLGMVTKVGTEDLQLGDGISEKIRLVTFKLIEVYRGDIKAGDTAQFRLSPLLSTPIKPGERLLWYLPEESRLGLTAPIGLHSGYFKIQDQKLARPADPNKKEQVESKKKEGGASRLIALAINLKNNAGLFPRGGPAFTETEVRVASDSMPEIQDSQELLQDYAKGSGRPRPIPLQLLIAATKSRLKN